MQHALNYNPPKHLAPWSIELLCMLDEEVFSFSIPFFPLPMSRVKLKFSFTSVLSMQILETMELKIKQFFLGHLLCVLDNMFLNVLGIGITLTWNRSDFLLRIRSRVYAVECEV